MSGHRTVSGNERQGIGDRHQGGDGKKRRRSSARRSIGPRILLRRRTTCGSRMNTAGRREWIGLGDLAVVERRVDRNLRESSRSSDRNSCESWCRVSRSDLEGANVDWRCPHNGIRGIGKAGWKDLHREVDDVHRYRPDERQVIHVHGHCEESVWVESSLVGVQQNYGETQVVRWNSTRTTAGDSDPAPVLVAT